MKTKLFLFCAVILLSFCSNAQNLIARHTGGTVIFYTTPLAAVSVAINGDTIYIPAGTYPGFSINASIVLYGVGYDADSTSATGKSFISSVINVYASNCRLEGMHLNGGLTLHSGVINSTIARCFISSTFSLIAGSSATTAYNNILYVINGNNSQNNFFSNNIMFYYTSGLDYSIFKNNTLCYEGTQPTSGFDFSEISNNIFLNDSYSDGGNYNNQINNNLFCNITAGDPPCDGFPFTNSNLCDDNIMGVDEFSIFIEYTEGLLQANYNQNNLHADAGSVIISAGSDGTDLGIYGGAFPWNDGGLPQNPHTFFKSIPSVSDNDGTLDIEININAQDN